MNCANCGALLPDGSTVCFECGAPQKVTASPSQTTARPSETAVPNPTTNFSGAANTNSASELRCKNCGALLTPGATVCFECGVAQNAQASNGGYNTSSANNTSAGFGAPLNTDAPKTNNTANTFNQNINRIANSVNTAPKSKVVAGLLALFLGSIGLDQFYIGHIKWGLLRLGLTVVSAGVISTLWGFFDCYRIFAGIIKTDANGNPLV